MDETRWASCYGWIRTDRGTSSGPTRAPFTDQANVPRVGQPRIQDWQGLVDWASWPGCARRMGDENSVSGPIQMAGESHTNTSGGSEQRPDRLTRMGVKEQFTERFAAAADGEARMVVERGLVTAREGSCGCFVVVGRGMECWFGCSQLKDVTTGRVGRASLLRVALQSAVPVR